MCLGAVSERSDNVTYDGVSVNVRNILDKLPSSKFGFHYPFKFLPRSLWTCWWNQTTTHWAEPTRAFCWNGCCLESLTLWIFHGWRILVLLQKSLAECVWLSSVDKSKPKVPELWKAFLIQCWRGTKLFLECSSPIGSVQLVVFDLSFLSHEQSSVEIAEILTFCHDWRCFKP